MVRLTMAPGHAADDDPALVERVAARPHAGRELAASDLQRT